LCTSLALAQPPSRHFLAVIGKAEVRPHEVEFALAAGHDVARRQEFTAAG
jgi:hypothetical protein